MIIYYDNLCILGWYNFKKLHEHGCTMGSNYTQGNNSFLFEASENKISYYTHGLLYTRKCGIHAGAFLGHR